MTRDEIRRQFESGEITWQQAIELLRRATKPWHTTLWKKRRIEVLGECCETCGSREEPLVIQHRWHPALFADLCQVAKDFRREEYAANHPFAAPTVTPFDPSSVPLPELEERDCCPRCQSVAVKYSKRTNDWSCNGRVKHRSCGNYFDQPVKRLWSKWTHEELIEMARKRHQRIIPKAERSWEQGFVDEYADRICFLATKLSFLEHDRYMEMRDSDVITLCKKCAFKEDVMYVYHPGIYGKQIGRSSEMIRRWNEERQASLSKKQEQS